MKPWYKSRTLIVNAAVAALAAFELVSGLLQPFLPVNVFTAVAVGLPVINAILRVITTQPLGVPPKDE